MLAVFFLLEMDDNLHPTRRPRYVEEKPLSQRVSRASELD